MSAHAVPAINPDAVQLPANSAWRKLPLVGAVLAVVGLGGTFAIGSDDHSHYFSYLTAYLFFLTIALGSLFFCMIFFLTRSSWNVALRRLAENFAISLPLFAVLFIPIVLGMEHIFHWLEPGLAEHDKLMEHKAPYLNAPFFLARAAFYFVAWTALAWLFWSKSVAQDTSGDHKITRFLQAVAAPGIAVAALTMTFAMFDWNMSIDFHWFSTMYGVIHFAGGFLGCFAMLLVFVYLLERGGLLRGVISVEHYHGLGKMLFGMNCFWAYVSFSQFMLIWYANIPEETLWYYHRWEGTWAYATILLGVGHFVVPFFALMSHNVKRHKTAIFFGALWMLAMHYLDLYWMVMPGVHHHGAHFGILDILSLLGVGGAFLAVVGFAMQKNALVAIKDPRLSESIRYEN